MQLSLIADYDLSIFVLGTRRCVILLLSFSVLRVDY